MSTDRNILHDIFPREKQVINSKRKGNRNELILCKQLTRWTGVEFNRIPQSGGLRWQNVTNICGDVLCTDPSFRFPYVIETKDISNLVITSSLRKNSFIYNAWKQVVSDSQRSKRMPMLFMRRTGDRPREKYTLFLWQTTELEKLFKDKDVGIISVGSISLHPHTKAYGIIGVNSINFFDNVKHDAFTGIYQQDSKILTGNLS